MPTSETPPGTSKWYDTERNTEALVKAVMAARPVHGLSADAVWWLLQLTWINVSKGHPTKGHWKKLKVPALAHLFNKKGSVSDDLESTLAKMQLSPPIVQAAVKETGFVNAYSAYRNSLRGWCSANIKQLRAILADAENLKPNDKGRFDLASKIEQLPPVPTPSGKHKMVAANLITPLVACLDPKNKFPIINGEKGVTRRLAKLNLVNRDLNDQVRGFIGLVGQFGIADAFAVDTMTEDQIEKIKKRAVKPYKATGGGDKGSTLHEFDEAERKAVQESRTVTYKQRHNKMTNRLKELLQGLTLTQGNNLNYRYDVLAKDYDRKGRNLLIEVKPGTNKGSIRIAIGQLLDYRRFLPHQAGTDLAILTISRPPQDYIEFLQDLQITALWFATESCQTLAGDGKIWDALKNTMGHS
jgi:hypothetical protein